MVVYPDTFFLSYVVEGSALAIMITMSQVQKCIAESACFTYFRNCVLWVQVAFHD
jgi:hypothetical protein